MLSKSIPAGLFVLEVHPVYLEAAFLTINDEYGSVERYIRQGLGISKRGTSLSSHFLFVKMTY
jgi:protein tyrosine/serine phosphatase